MPKKTPGSENKKYPNITIKKESGLKKKTKFAGTKTKLKKIDEDGLEFDLSRTGELELDQPETRDDQNLLEIEEGAEEPEIADDKLEDDVEEEDKGKDKEQEQDEGEDVTISDEATGEDIVGDPSEFTEAAGCFYDFAKQKTKAKLDELDDNFETEEVYDDDNKIHDIIVKDEDRTTKPQLTIYERVRILGDRSRQLLGGAKPMLKNVENMNPKDIAKLELKNGVIPLKIKRQLPNGKIEIWKVSELKIIN